MSVFYLTVDIPARSRLASQEPERPSRWRTVEFRIYAVFVFLIVLSMAWVPIRLSFPTHPNYPLFRNRLSRGWIFGRPVDNSDAQYRGFRSNFVPLILAAAAYLVAKHVRTRIHGPTAPRDNTYLIRFNLGASVAMLIALHGTSVLKILPILTAELSHLKGPLFSWIFNGAVLVMNDRYGGYRFGRIIPSLAYLDSFDGIYPRWHISFNITMLRLLSFSMDYYWAVKRSTYNADEIQTPSKLDEKQRQTMTHPDSMYSYLNYISYVLYPPLYLAGPIMTFNDYIWQNRKPANIPAFAIRGYFIRFVISMLTMEFILHFMYVVAMKDTKAWRGASPAEIGLIGFWNLMIVWLKLLIPWRFFRLWAMLDGIETPENMIRCVVNNYSTLGFWRSWHRSYNLWITRYIYIPVGGANRVVLNTLLVFTFVALWHDLTFKLLAWGWLVSLFIIPELTARFLLPESKYGNERWYRHVCAAGAVCNFMLMMTANLVGFVLGVDGIKFFVQQLFGSAEGLRFLVITSVAFYAAAHLMFEYREEEKRKGIFRRC
ncbi:MBOAT, membrane-bound O-acyltransferase family-domain-containing protein [Mycena rebaudengoi]|nr:MBOAT, membrane-bound O-acyltransferase family-domain-containing protein [Mycena rebaudengoi]